MTTSSAQRHMAVQHYLHLSYVAARQIAGDDESKYQSRVDIDNAALLALGVSREEVINAVLDAVSEDPCFLEHGMELGPRDH